MEPEQPIGKDLPSADAALAQMRAHHGLISIEDCHAHIRKLEQDKALLLAALELCATALEQRDTEAEEYAAKNARSVINQHTGEKS